MKKNKKVALLLPYYEGRNHHQFLGIGYLSAVLKQAGYDTLIIDEDAVVFVKEKQQAEAPLISAKQYIIEKLKDYRPFVIGISINTANYEKSLDLLCLVRKHFPEVQIVVGGPHISTSWETLLKYHKNLFDIAVVGEGERTFVEICNRISSNNSSEGTRGTILSCTEVANYKHRSLIRNLDSLPFPDREGFYKAFSVDIQHIIDENYNYVFYSHLPGFRGKKYARIVGSRGCDFSCKFCSPSILWKDPLTGKNCRRIRDPVKVVNEIEYLVEKGYQAFYFDDPTFPFLSKPNFYKRMLLEIKKKGLNIRWAAPTRYDELSKDILLELFESGFTYTYFGLETFQNKKLIEMGKRIDIEKSLNLVRLCKEIGIHCDVSYQIGLPGESFDSIIKSIQWLEDQGLQKNSFFSIAAIWPETPWARTYGVKSDDFEPTVDKTSLETNGLFYFNPGNPQIERYFSNCSGNFHFIDEETAIRVKHYLIDSDFIKRFDKQW